jgi:hypothetical protein
MAETRIRTGTRGGMVGTADAGTSLLRFVMDLLD